jgi:hypothetical protein
MALAGTITVPFAMDKDGDRAPTGARPELEYLEAVNRAGPPRDPQLLFLLMGQYANANLHREGAEHLAALLKEFEPRLSDEQKSLYLSAIGALRAGHANEVSLLRRFGWVKDTIAILEDARDKSGGNIYELAANALDWARDRYPGSARLESMERLAYLKLTEKYQEFNPFKFIIYSGKGGLDLPQLAPVTAATATGKSK